MNITIKNELKSFGSTSIYYYLCVDKKWPNIWLDLCGNGQKTGNESNLIFHIVWVQLTMSMTSSLSVYSHHLKITHPFHLSEFEIRRHENRSLKLNEFYCRFYFLAEQSYSCILSVAMCFVCGGKIRSNFNHVNGLAVNSQATFVVYHHCFPSTRGFQSDSTCHSSLQWQQQQQLGCWNHPFKSMQSMRKWDTNRKIA